MRGVLQVLLAMKLLFALFALTVAAEPARCGSKTVARPKDSFSLADPEHRFESYDADIPQLGLGKGKQSHNQTSPNPLSARAIIQLFKRTCYFTNNGESRYCSDVEICCQYSADVGWCCPNNESCNGPTIDIGCKWSVEWVTIVQTSTIFTTQYSTDVQSVAETTEWNTEYSTSVVVETRSDISTATETETVTVTAEPAKRRWLTTKPTPSPVPTTVPVVASTETSEEQPTCQTVAADLLELRVPDAHLFRRQVALRTDTSTTTSIRTEYHPTVAVVTSFDYYTETSTTNAVVTSTSTSAVAAETTVTETTTSTFTPAAEPSSGAPTSGPRTSNNGPSSNGGAQPTGRTTSNNGGGAQETQVANPNASNNGGSSLSKGAQVGIGVGTAAGSLIICIILGFLWRRRRKNKKAEVQEMINAAVAAANDSRSPTDPKLAPYAGTVPIPPQSPGSDRYSGMTAVGKPGSPPGVTYRYPSPGSEAMYSSHEMSGTPAPMAAPVAQYQYPRPVSTDPYAQGPQEMYQTPHQPHEAASGYPQPWQQQQNELPGFRH